MATPERKEGETPEEYNKRVDAIMDALIHKELGLPKKEQD